MDPVDPDEVDEGKIYAIFLNEFASFQENDSFKLLNFQPYLLSTTIPQGKAQNTTET